MKDFVCKKCGNTTYIVQEKSNGTGLATGLYCAKCGTWHKWLNKQEKILYSTHSEEIDKDNEIARLTAENAELTSKARQLEEEIKALKKEKTQLETTMDGISAIAHSSKTLANELQAENEQLKQTISEMETVEAQLRARIDKAIELPCKVGDTIHSQNGDQAKISGIIIEKVKVRFEWEKFKERELLDCGTVLIDDYNKTWFTSQGKTKT